MINTENWNYYYNVDNGQQIRANLVYTPLVSSDNKNFCMWFYRDYKYHFDIEQNKKWTEELLTDRFNKELKYWKIAKEYVPTLEIIDVDFNQRKIIIEWPGDDFYMQSYNKDKDHVLKNWKYYWKCNLKKLWENNVVKLSLHPNSWVVKDGMLVPFNWFFCYDRDTGNDCLNDLLIQISDNRLEKLYDLYKMLGLDPTKHYSADELQIIALNSFKSNYDEDLIKEALTLLNETAS